VRFCPQCGASVVVAARFCVECGESLAASGESSIPTSAAALRMIPSSGSAGISSTADDVSSIAGARPSARSLSAFIAVFFFILIVGLAVAFLILRQLPARERLLASAPKPQPPSELGGRQLPPGHPTVQLPQKARDFIGEIERKAQAHPTDLSAWNRLGDVMLRAALFDPSYYAKSADAYAHVLKADPDNLDALRGVGNIDFDQQKYDQAIAAYEHFLSRRPDDPDVRTDLGTMLLSTGVPDQAVHQYRKVLERRPDFFEANFNLGIAYSQMSNSKGARAAFEKSLESAPNPEARNRVNEMITSLNGAETAQTAPASAAASNPLAQTAQGAAKSNGSTFRDGIEQMLRDLPIAGPKVQSVQWDSDTKARVMMDNFPMEQMPPFAAAKFMSDLKAGIDQVKSAHKIDSAVKMDIADAASGRVMRSLTE
jgi:tetratricopeptide (TPR) repeat protein